MFQVRKWAGNQLVAQGKAAPEIYVVSKYIDDPLLVGGKKFDLRLYVLVLSYKPLKVYVSDLGLYALPHSITAIHKNKFQLRACMGNTTACRRLMPAPGYLPLLRMHSDSSVAVSNQAYEPSGRVAICSARFCNVKYDFELDELDNKFMHLTNVAIQKHGEEYNSAHGNKWTLQNLKLWLTSTVGARPS